MVRDVIDAYDRRCQSAAADQGLGPPALLLSYAGWKPEVWQSGGFTMVLIVDLKLAQIWVTWEGDDEYIVGYYTNGSLEDSTEALEYNYVGLDQLLEAVEGMADYGI
jgi:hypothetical protein